MVAAARAAARAVRGVGRGHGRMGGRVDGGRDRGVACRVHRVVGVSGRRGRDVALRDLSEAPARGAALLARVEPARQADGVRQAAERGRNQ